MATLIRMDKNGTRYMKGMITCDRCGGGGYYIIGINNGQPVLSPVDGGICYKCGGAGKVEGKWKEYTPEYEAKLEARRQARLEKKQAEWEAQQAQIEAERKAKEEQERIAREAEEARIKAEKAISKYVGQIGDKIAIKAVYDHSAHFEVSDFYGFGTTTMYIHTFKDVDGNKLIWKTGCCLDSTIEESMEITLKGTIKAHSEYKDEKQTVLTRCKVIG